MVKERSIAPANIILWGYSIGASASVELAAKTSDVAGLVLLSPPVSFLRTLCWCKSCRKRTCCHNPKPCPCDNFTSIRKVQLYLITDLMKRLAKRRFCYDTTWMSSRSVSSPSPCLAKLSGREQKLHLYTTDAFELSDNGLRKVKGQKGIADWLKLFF